MRRASLVAGVYCFCAQTLFAVDLEIASSPLEGDRGNASQGTFSEAQLSDTAIFYEPSWDSRGWVGNLVAWELGSRGKNIGQPVKKLWAAGSKLEEFHSLQSSRSRTVITYDKLSRVGIPFSSDNEALIKNLGELLANQKNSKPVRNRTIKFIDFLRGDSSNEEFSREGLKQEKSETVFRHRKQLLGDIVHSPVVYVGRPHSYYKSIAKWPEGSPENSFGAQRYPDYVDEKSSRRPVVYVGANDGMLHGFNASADGGNEIIGYIPASVYPHLLRLAMPDYVDDHRFFVDGGIAVNDVFFKSDKRWHTILVGSLGAGGQGVFALDVSDPEYFEDASADRLVLWEFMDSDSGKLMGGDRDLGFTYGTPQIVRLANGDWAAVFGNGYNNTVADGSESSTGNAVLYLVNAETGELIKKIDMEAGNGRGENRPNGLSTPAIADVDGDIVADYAYAGDLYGNLWKIDLTGSSVEGWGSAFSNAGKPVPFFRAGVCNTSGSFGVNAACPSSISGKPQPVTTRPSIGRHSSGQGVMVYFGTGQFLTTGDRASSDNSVQGFYGLWDRGQRVSRSGLVQQRIVTEVSVEGEGFRVITNEPVEYEKSEKQGWVLDLLSGFSNSGEERVVYDSLLRNGRVIFSTLIPGKGGGADGGWVMELDAMTGGRLPLSPFDVNRNDQFDEDDLVSLTGSGEGVPVGGMKGKYGAPRLPAIIRFNDSKYGPVDIQYVSGSQGTLQIIFEQGGINVGRRSWRLLEGG